MLDTPTLPTTDVDLVRKTTKPKSYRRCRPAEPIFWVVALAAALLVTKKSMGLWSSKYVTVVFQVGSAPF